LESKNADVIDPGRMLASNVAFLILQGTLTMQA